MPLVLGLLALGALAWALKSNFPTGAGPHDSMPLGFTGAPSSVDAKLKSPSSGRYYRVESWPANGAGETFHVAFPYGRSDAYVSYVNNSASGKRSYFRGYGPPADVAAMRSDFKL